MQYVTQSFEYRNPSPSWRGNAIVGWTNTIKKEEILNLLFDETNSLRLNVARYNIGGVGHHNHNAIESALELTNKIHDDVCETQIKTWVY